MNKNYSIFGVLEGIVTFWAIVIAYAFIKQPKKAAVVLGVLSLAVAFSLSLGFPQVAAEEAAAGPQGRVHPYSESAPSESYGDVDVLRYEIDGIRLRNDACHTYNVGAAFGGDESTHAISCGLGFVITATVGVTPTAEITETSVVTETPVTPTVVPTGTPTIEITETSIVTVTVTVEPTQPPVTGTPEMTATPAGPGNPGNDKPVGQTEHCEKGMCENEGGQDGEHGQSDNDSGRGNHDH
jgi:hypothetical protein